MRTRARLPWVSAGFVALACAVLVMVATRGGIRMSPDSITYLSVADHIHHWRGLTDLTGDQLTVFGPVLPVLLAPGGRSELWASIVSAACVAAITLMLFALLHHRCRTGVALAACAVLGAGQALVLVAASAYSEMPYLVCSLAVFVVLLPRVTVGRCIGAGTLAALGFVARYAGASLIVAGAVVVIAGSWRAPARDRVRVLAAYIGASAAVAGGWVVHNLIVVGQPLGPRFEGGASESLGEVIRRPFISLGQVLLTENVSVSTAHVAGIGAVVMVIVGSAVLARRRSFDPIVAGMVAYAVMNFVVPVIARTLTASDVSPRVMSPMLVPVVFLGALGAHAISRWRVGIGVVGVITVLWLWQGVAMADRVPDMASSGSRTIYSSQLHDLVDELPPDAQILTNNPWGIWWQNRRDPALFAFTRPRPGNGYFPISGERILHLACTRPTYLAWFPSLRNAGDGPVERRPDLLEVVDLVLEHTVSRGELYRVEPHDPAQCTA